MMKNFTIFLLIASFSLMQLFAGLEASVEMKNMGPEPSTQLVTIKTQDDKMRNDMGDTSIIINSKSNEILTLMHNKKMFMRMPGDALTKFSEVMDPSSKKTPEAKPSNLSLQKTGKKETISGFVCEEYTMKEQGLTLWLTKDPKISTLIQQLLLLQKGESDPFHGMLAKVEGVDGQPIRILSKEMDKSTQWTLLSVKEKSIPAQDFAPPSNYKTLQVPTNFGDILKQLP